MDLLADAPALAAADLWQVRLQLEQFDANCFGVLRAAAWVALCAARAAFFVSVSFLSLIAALGRSGGGGHQQQEREQ